MSIYQTETNKTFYDSFKAFLGLTSQDPGKAFVSKNYVDNLVFYRPYDVLLNQSGTGAPTETRMMAGDCTKNCSSDCVACGCTNCNDADTTNFNTVWTRSSAGHYVLTLTLGPDYAGYRGLALFFTPVSDPGYSLTIVKISETVYNVNTYSTGAGAYVDGIIDGMYLSIRVYQKAGVTRPNL